MKTVIFMGKRTKAGSPLAQWPGAELCGTTNSQQKYEKKLGNITDWSSWWDLHPFNPTPFYRGIKALRPRTYDWYKTLPGPDAPDYRPLWLFESDPHVPAGKLFPTEEVLDAFKIPGEGWWFTCQVDWMMAFHILRGYQHIVLHGHGVSRELDHMIRHRGILYWIAVARERGVQVTVVRPSWYFSSSKPYGIASGGGADQWQG